MYNLDFDQILEKTKDSKRVLVQLPDGLKPRAKEIVEFIEEKTEAEVFLWLSNCFGACDIPLGVDKLGIDTILQFGHSKFFKEEEW